MINKGDLASQLALYLAQHDIYYNELVTNTKNLTLKRLNEILAKLAKYQAKMETVQDLLRKYFNE